MAKYEDNNQEILLDFASNARGEVIRVSKLTGVTSGNQSIDIRRYYTNNDGEKAPTSKGIRFSTEDTVDVIKALMSTLSEEELQLLNESID